MIANSSAFGEPVVFAASAVLRRTDSEPSAAETVQALYRQVLKRSADASGLENYVSAIADGSKVVKEIVRELIHSDEWAQRFIHGRTVEETVLAIYDCVLSRAPDLGAWRQLTAWEPRAGWQPVIDEMIDGSEYAERFGDHIVPGTST